MQVDGLPESALGLAAQAASKEKGHEGATPESGPWLFTLDFPSYFPVSIGLGWREPGQAASCCCTLFMLALHP
jgi:Zn-dependent oligopeptidase